jgi:HEAT repeat protein
MIPTLILALLVSGAPTWAPLPAAAGGEQSQEQALYTQGTAALDAARWDQAAEAFAKVAALKGERADAALYWRAYALNKSGRKDDALASLSALKSGYPKSRWLKDARALDLEIRQASGQTPRVAAEGGDEDLKLMALGGLMNADPERAMPLIKQMLSGNPSPKVRDRALFVLAQSGSPAAREALVAMAKNSGDPDLQGTAVHYLGLFGGQESRQALVDIYGGTSNPEVKKAVLQGFMLAGDRTRLAEIARKETSPELRQEAIQQLGVAGGRDELAQMYQQEKTPEVRETIINALFVSGAVDQMTALATKETDPELRRSAIQHLGLMGMKTEATLKSLYASERDEETRKAVLNAFFVQNNGAALVEIARREQDPARKKEIVGLLSVMHSKEAADYMMELLK